MVRAWAGGSCQVGTIPEIRRDLHRRKLGLVSRPSPCSGTSAVPSTLQSSKKSCACSRVAASVCQRPGPGKEPVHGNAASHPWAGACRVRQTGAFCVSLGVRVLHADAQASSASSASLRVSTRSCGHSRLNSCMRVVHPHHMKWGDRGTPWNRLCRATGVAPLRGDAATRSGQATGGAILAFMWPSHSSR